MGAAPAVPGQIQTGCEATFLYREVVKHRDRLPGEVVDAPRLSVFERCLEIALFYVLFWLALWWSGRCTLLLSFCKLVVLVKCPGSDLNTQWNFIFASSRQCMLLSSALAKRSYRNAYEVMDVQCSSTDWRDRGVGAAVLVARWQASVFLEALKEQDLFPFELHFCRVTEIKMRSFCMPLPWRSGL